MEQKSTIKKSIQKNLKENNCTTQIHFERDFTLHKDHMKQNIAALGRRLQLYNKNYRGNINDKNILTVKDIYTKV